MSSCVCRDMSAPMTLAELNYICEMLSNPHVFAPYGETRGMVSENVKEEDFECCPSHPNQASCPRDGCRWCKE